VQVPHRRPDAEAEEKGDDGVPETLDVERLTERCVARLKLQVGTQQHEPWNGRGRDGPVDESKASDARAGIPLEQHRHQQRRNDQREVVVAVDPGDGGQAVQQPVTRPVGLHGPEEEPRREHRQEVEQHVGAGFLRVPDVNGGDRDEYRPNPGGGGSSGHAAQPPDDGDEQHAAQHRKPTGGIGSKRADPATEQKMIERREAVLSKDDVPHRLPRQSDFSHLIHCQALRTQPPEPEAQRQPAHGQSA